MILRYALSMMNKRFYKISIKDFWNKLQKSNHKNIKNRVHSRCSLNIATNDKDCESLLSEDVIPQESTNRTDNNLVKVTSCYDYLENGNIVNINLKSCSSNNRIEDTDQIKSEYDPYSNVDPSKCISVQSQSFRKSKKVIQRNNSNLLPTMSRRIKSLSRDSSNTNNRYPKPHGSFHSIDNSKSNSKLIKRLANQLLKSRCKDLGISIINDKMKENFMSTANTIFDGKLLNFRDLGLGPESCKVVSKILNEYMYNEESELNEKQKLCLPTHINLSNMTKLKFSKVNGQSDINESANDVGVKMIINSIIKHKSLIYINLQNNDMNDEILCILFKGLQLNNTIVHIDIGNGYVLGRNKIRIRAAEALKELLCVNKVLQILNIENCGINQETFPIITSGILSSNVISLNLSSNDINNTCIQTLTEDYLNLKYQLIELKLGNIKINDKCCYFLTTFLHESKLQKLDLSNNQLQITNHIEFEFY